MSTTVGGVTHKLVRELHTHLQQERWQGSFPSQVEPKEIKNTPATNRPMVSKGDILKKWMERGNVFHGAQLLASQVKQIWQVCETKAC